MNMNIAINIECAKGEIMNTMQKIQDKYALPPCIIDGIISSVLADVRSQAKLELLNETSSVMQNANEELEKAKAEAKKVLKEHQEA